MLDALLQQAEEPLDLQEALSMVPEVPVKHQRVLVGFEAKRHGFIASHLSIGPVEQLGLAAAQSYEAMVLAAGEPMALRVMSSVSSILQHVPQSADLQPLRPWLATLLMMAWELSGSDEVARAPHAASDADQEEKSRCTAQYLEWMVSKPAWATNK